MRAEKTVVARQTIGENMNRIFLSLLLSTAWLDAHAQASLPPCVGERSLWTKCFGTTLFSDGREYTGEWVDGEPHGLGTMTGPSGEKYVGGFRDGEFSGEGAYSWPSGEKHWGEFQNGKYNGQGTHVWDNGDKYTGDFHDGKQHGEGTYKWADGHQYSGTWRDGLKHGRGTQRYPTGGQYVGDFQADRRHGRGTLTTTWGDQFVGNWRDDKVFGQGSFTQAGSGFSFVGYFDGSSGFSGSGKLVTPDGQTIAEGAWDERFTLNAAGARWEHLDVGNPEAIYFVSPSSVRQIGEFRRAWIMLAIASRSSDSQVRSIRSLEEIDCLNVRSRTLDSSRFTGAFGSGRVLSSQDREKDWRYAAPGTVGEGLVKAICEYRLNE